MPFSRCLMVISTISVVLLTHAVNAAAHGVDVTADLAPLTDDGNATTARLELTDETGEVCIALDPTPPPSTVAAISNTAGQILIILGEGFGPTEACQFFDAATVNGVLDDVDGHQLVLAFGSNESSGTLTKPPPPASETALSTATDSEADEDNGPNVPLIFGVGAAIGISIAVVRSRLRSRAQS